MRGYANSTTASTHPHLPNAFTASFLGHMAERDEPLTAGDADVAGPWRIEPILGHGFGLFRVGESLARGFTPTAVFPSRWLALLAAAILPGTGKDPLLLLSKEADADGVYPVTSPAEGTETAAMMAAMDQSASFSSSRKRRPTP